MARRKTTVIDGVQCENSWGDELFVTKTRTWLKAESIPLYKHLVSLGINPKSITDQYIRLEREDTYTLMQHLDRMTMCIVGSSDDDILLPAGEKVPLRDEPSVLPFSQKDWEVAREVLNHERKILCKGGDLCKPALVVGVEVVSGSVAVKEFSGMDDAKSYNPVLKGDYKTVTGDVLI